MKSVFHFFFSSYESRQMEKNSFEHIILEIQWWWRWVSVGWCAWLSEVTVPWILHRSVLVLCQDSCQKVTIRSGILLQVIFVFIWSIYLNFHINNDTPILTVQLNASRYSICQIGTSVMELNFAVNRLMHAYLIVKLTACCLLGLSILTYLILMGRNPSCISKAADSEIVHIDVLIT